MSLFEFLLQVIAPHRCVSCSIEGQLLCTPCALDLASIPSRCYRCNRLTVEYRTCASCRRQSGLYQVWMATPYELAAKDLVHRIKFDRAQAGVRNVAMVLAARFVLDPDLLITHVPTAGSRVRLRGYDQAQLIARELARLSGNAYSPLLARIGAARQVGHGRTARRQQMKGAFMVTRPAAVQRRHILLVDDVLTTGATCEAAAAALKMAGAKRVSALVFAAA